MILVIDTATRTPVVALANADGAVVAERRWESHHRHGEELIEKLNEVIAEAGEPRDQISAVVVGTGPGSFTGLRIGLATAKTIAYAMGVPIIGVSSTLALASAASESGQATVTLPAGAADRYVHKIGARASQPKLVAGMDADADSIAIDIDSAPAAARERGQRALEGLAAALAAIGARRLAAGDSDDVSTLVPAYVALPRGIARAAVEMKWSPDLR